MPLLARCAGQGSVTRRRRARSLGARRSIMPMIVRAMRVTILARSSGLSGAPSASAIPRLCATSWTGPSMRVSPSLGSSTISRPPTAIAAVATMRPFSMSANLVVPPPMSTLSSVALWPRESATAPEPCAASWHSMWWPAEAQTKRPASSENRSAMARALWRLIASPVSTTAPLSMSAGSTPA